MARIEMQYRQSCIHPSDFPQATQKSKRKIIICNKFCWEKTKSTINNNNNNNNSRRLLQN